MYLNTITTSIPEFIEITVWSLNQISESEWTAKPSLDKWSRKQILGHLIDSAMTNIRRLIVTQYHQNEKIVYAQNAWVEYSGYQDMATQDLISLWRLMNLQYDRIAQRIPSSSLAFTCDTSKETISLTPLSFLIEDYWGHQQHHLKQIF